MPKMLRSRRALLLVPVLLVAAGLSACGGGGGSQATAAAQPATAPPAATSAATPRKRGATVKVASSDYGRVLFDGRGRALYLFTHDRPDRSRCYGDCAAAWPPFLTEGEPVAGAGARQRLLATTRRRGGKRQVTYAGHPLYYYVGDRRAGQILCQDVFEFGGRWLVVSPSGRAVR